MHDPVGLHDRVAKAIIENGDFNHGLTYSGHPVAAAVAVANLKLLRDEKIIERVKNDTGPYFQRLLRETFANHPIVGDISGTGLVAGIQLAQDPKTRKRFENGGDVGTICRDFCFNSGLIMRATGDRMLLAPPLVITKEKSTNSYRFLFASSHARAALTVLQLTMPWTFIALAPHRRAQYKGARPGFSMSTLLPVYDLSARSSVRRSGILQF